VLENSDSHLSPNTPSLFDSLQENMVIKPNFSNIFISYHSSLQDEVLNARLDSKAACPICIIINLTIEKENQMIFLLFR
jgi:hypothetical protein